MNDQDTLNENGDMVNGKQEDRTIWHLRYEDLSYIPVNMEHQREARLEQRETKTPIWHRITWKSGWHVESFNQQ